MPLKSCCCPICTILDVICIVIRVIQVQNQVAYYFLYFESFGTIHKKEMIFELTFSISTVFGILYLYFPSKKYNVVTQTGSP